MYTAIEQLRAAFAMWLGETTTTTMSECLNRERIIRDSVRRVLDEAADPAHQPDKTSEPDAGHIPDILLEWCKAQDKHITIEWLTAQQWETFACDVKDADTWFHHSGDVQWAHAPESSYVRACDPAHQPGECETEAACQRAEINALQCEAIADRDDADGRMGRIEQSAMETRNEIAPLTAKVAGLETRLGDMDDRLKLCVVAPLATDADALRASLHADVNQRGMPKRVADALHDVIDHVHILLDAPPPATMWGLWSKSKKEWMAFGDKDADRVVLAWPTRSEALDVSLVCGGERDPRPLTPATYEKGE